MIVMDEFHFWGSPARLGVAGAAPGAADPQVVAMSATLGDTTRFERAWRTRARRVPLIDDAGVPYSVRVRRGPPYPATERLLGGEPLARLHRALLPARRGCYRAVFRPFLADVAPSRRRQSPRSWRVSFTKEASGRPANRAARAGHRRAPRGHAAALPSPRRAASTQAACAAKSCAAGHTPWAWASTCRSAQC